MIAENSQYARHRRVARRTTCTPASENHMSSQAAQCWKPAIRVGVGGGMVPVPSCQAIPAAGEGQDEADRPGPRVPAQYGPPVHLQPEHLIHTLRESAQSILARHPERRAYHRRVEHILRETASIPANHLTDRLRQSARYTPPPTSSASSSAPGAQPAPTANLKLRARQPPDAAPPPPITPMPPVTSARPVCAHLPLQFRPRATPPRVDRRRILPARADRRYQISCGGEPGRGQRGCSAVAIRGQSSSGIQQEISRVFSTAAQCH